MAVTQIFLVARYSFRIASFLFILARPSVNQLSVVKNPKIVLKKLDGKRSGSNPHVHTYVRTHIRSTLDHIDIPDKPAGLTSNLIRFDGNFSCRRKTTFCSRLCLALLEQKKTEVKNRTFVSSEPQKRTSHYNQTTFSSLVSGKMNKASLIACLPCRST